MDAHGNAGGAVEVELIELSRERQTPGSEHGAAGSAEARSCEQEDSESFFVSVAVSLSIRCSRSALAGRKAALEAALLKTVAEFDGEEFTLQMRVGPSEDTLQRVLPLVLEHVAPDFFARCYHACRPWRREMEARGFCNRTVQLCSALADGRDFERLVQTALRLLNASNSHAERLAWSDVNSFLQKSKGWKGGLREWLQFASQEPDASFLSKGAASTALMLGLPLIRWVGKPQGGGPGVHTLTAHSRVVSSVAVSSDGKRFFTGSDDKLVKIWNAETGAEVRTLRGHSRFVRTVAISPDGTHVVSGAGDRLVKIWNVETGAQVHTLGHTCTGSCVCSWGIDQDGDDTLEIHPQCPAIGHSAAVTSIDFSPDGRRFVSASGDNLVKVWDAETRAEVWSTRTHDCKNNGSNGCICTMQENEDAYQTLVRNPWCPVTGHSANVKTVAFSPDGTRVVSGSYDKTVKIWDAATGALVCTMSGHSFQVSIVAFSPDGKRVVSASHDKLVKIWDAATGAEVCTLTGHAHIATRVEFSDDGAQVITASEDNTVRFWDVASGRQVRQLAGRHFALVEGSTDAHTHQTSEFSEISEFPATPRGRHVLVARGDMLLIYEFGKEMHAGDAPVACFKAPQFIRSVRCHGAAFCVGCWGGTLDTSRDCAVCVLSAPFLL